MKKVFSIPSFSGILILLFMYACLSKMSDYQMFEVQLTRFPYIGGAASMLAWCIPLAEAFTAALLFIPGTRLAGFTAAALLLFVFTIFLVIMVAFAQNLPCSCGGLIARLSWRQHIFFNLFFLGIASAGIYLEKQRSYIRHGAMP